MAPPFCSLFFLKALALADFAAQDWNKFKETTDKKIATRKWKNNPTPTCCQLEKTSISFEWRAHAAHPLQDGQGSKGPNLLRAKKTAGCLPVFFYVSHVSCATFL